MTMDVMEARERLSRFDTRLLRTILADETLRSRLSDVERRVAEELVADREGHLQ